MTKSFLFLFNICCCSLIWGQPFPYLNPSLSSNERAKDLISRLTVSEKTTLVLGNYNGYPANIISVLDGLKFKLSPAKIFYAKGCDLTEDLITESLLGKFSFDGKTGIKATYWSNKEFDGITVVSEQIVTPIQLTTAGQHQFASGVNLKDFPANIKSSMGTARH